MKSTLPPSALRIERSVTIHRPAQQIYAFWRDPAHLAGLFPGRATVTPISATRSHWSATGPGGRTYEWDAEIVRDAPEQEIAWESCEGADVVNSGTVTFDYDQADRGDTRVRVSIAYVPPGGMLGEIVGGLMQGRAEEEVDQALAEIKRTLEAETPLASS